MARRQWIFADRFLNRSDFHSYINDQNVSIKRTEQTNGGQKITYRCSECRKFPQCDFQTRCLMKDENEYIVSTSNTHNHSNRNATTRELEWSEKSVLNGFRTCPFVSIKQEKVAWKWKNGLDKSSILYWYGHTHVVPSSYCKQYTSSTWLHAYNTMPWTQFDEFSSWLYAGRLVTIPMMCSCKTNLKTYICKHAVGIMMHFGFYVVSDPGKLDDLGKRRGRPKKATSALCR
ncbi:unnamed protein product [Didymodactylos carnosus]|uniref:SWIM-type domain-containing protein n=1 Tax=Didymodactylos carnosus TaxID=1234261 RepID=A0A8S2DWV1_9BILA|nr:unnamed protein product [Didymodactylos carnosus]CAF3796710.1 unnamed protein product [Didymodactylos carnosus]